MWTCTLTLAVRSFNQVQRTLGNEVAWSLGHSFSFAATVSCDTSLRAPGPRNTGLTQDDWAGDVHLQTQRRKIRLSLQKIIRKTKRNPFICVVKQLINMINMLLPINPDFLGGGKLHNIYKRKRVIYKVTSPVHEHRWTRKPPFRIWTESWSWGRSALCCPSHTCNMTQL